MSNRAYVLLEDRGHLAVSGDDRLEFLQGLISNDIEKVGAAHAIYAALLTPQGKFLHDFFITQRGDGLLLDCERSRLDDLYTRLRRYRLRASVDLSDASDELVTAVLIGEGALAALDLPAEPGRAMPFAGGLAYVDPRLAGLGARAVLPGAGAVEALTAAGFTATPRKTYDQLRLGFGVPDGSRDLAVEKAFLMESNFDELNGIDWDKGCYVGQELTARTHYRGLVRKRLMPVEIDGPAPDAGTPVMLDGKNAGEFRSASDGLGLALLRLEQVEKATAEGKPLVAGEARLTPHKPDWAGY